MSPLPVLALLTLPHLCLATRPLEDLSAISSLELSGNSSLDQRPSKRSLEALNASSGHHFERSQGSHTAVGHSHSSAAPGPSKGGSSSLELRAEYELERRGAPPFFESRSPPFFCPFPLFCGFPRLF